MTKQVWKAEQRQTRINARQARRAHAKTARAWKHWAEVMATFRQLQQDVAPARRALVTAIYWQADIVGGF